MRYCCQVAFGWVQQSHCEVSYPSAFVATYFNTHIVSKLGDHLDVSVSLAVCEFSIFYCLLGGPFPRHILPEVSSAALCRESNLPPALLGNHKLRIAAIFIQRALCHRITAINLLMTSHLRNLRPYCHLALYSGLRLISCNQKE